MAAKFVSSKLIKNLNRTVVAGPSDASVAYAGSVAIEFVDKTTAWTRPEGFPSESTLKEFTQVIEENLGRLKPQTVKVAMKESEHQSDRDSRMHYTVYEFNGTDPEPIATQHFMKEREPPR